MDAGRARLSLIAALAVTASIPLLAAQPYALGSLGPVLAAGLYHAAVLVAGTALLDKICPSLVGRPERWALGWALGLGLCGQIFFLLNQVGASGGWMFGAVLAGGAIGAGLLYRRRSPFGAPERVDPGWALAVGLAAAFALWLSLSPPLFYDALMYHVGLPAQWAVGGGQPTEHHLYSTFPVLAESALAPLYFLIGGPALFTAGHGLVAVLLGALLWATAERTLGPKTGGPAALAGLTMPMVLFFVEGTKSDLFVGVFAAGALYALGVAGVRAHDEEGAEPGSTPVEGPRPRELALLFGLFLGLAAATKLSAASHALAVGLAALLIPSWRRSLGGARPLFVGAAVAAAVASPVYLRNAFLLGNPVFPLASSIFGGPAWQERAVAVLQGHVPRVRSFADLGLLLRLPWDLTFVSRDPTMNNIPGPLPLAAAVLLPLLRPLPRALGRFGIAALVTLPGWLLTYSILRLAPFVWLLFALVVGWVVARLWALRPVGPWAAGGLLAAGVASSLLFAVRADDLLLQGVWDVRLGRVSAEEHLAERYPPWRAYRFIDEELPEDAVIFLVSDPRLAYLKRRAVLSEFATRPLYDELLEASTSPEAFLERLRATGATHVLLSPAPFRRNARSWLDWSEQERRRFDEAMGRLEVLYDEGGFVLRQL